MFITVLQQMHDATFALPPPESRCFVGKVSVDLGLKWVQLSYGLPGLRLSQFPLSSCKSFFLWEDLGHDVTGRAFLASPKNCQVCVVKCFFSKDKSNAEIELRNWTVVYGKTYPVCIQKLLTCNCLLMRYFSFISPELRCLYLLKVRKCLQ